MGTDKVGIIFDRIAGLEAVHEAVLYIEDTSGGFRYNRSCGGKGLDTPMLMASITKMLTAACVLALDQQGKLSLRDRAIERFDDAALEGIHVLNGRDYSKELTIADLLFQISGLPDAFEEGALKRRLMREDFCFSFEDLLGEVKSLRPHFAPGGGAKAHYADINYDILGRIIENTTGLGLSEAYDRHIFMPLGLKGTYLPENENDPVPGIYCREKLLHRPKFVKSSRASGGCVSTANDLMRIMKAFFGGKLFDIDVLTKISRFKELQPSFSPIRYGGGLMQIPLSGIHTLFLGKGQLIGHSGSTGSFAFYYPVKDLYFVGDLNQMADASLPIKLVMRLAMTLK